MFVKIIFISFSPEILSNPIEYLKGVGPPRAELLKKELAIFSFNDLLNHFPYRHIDKTKVNLIADINSATEYIQVAGILLVVEVAGQKGKSRLVAQLKDKSGFLELTWFEGVSWIHKNLQVGQSYLVYGRVSFYQGHAQMVHPEMEPLTDKLSDGKDHLEPIYPSTEKLKSKGLGGRQIGKLTQALFTILKPGNIPENIPSGILKQLKLMPRHEAYRQIHFPSSFKDYDAALRRLKFEEFFLSQVRLGKIRLQRHQVSKGVVFDKVGPLFNKFYTNYLPFELTGAQKRVIKEIRNDTAKGHQMNRLLQGDVGSGKTIVALLSMLLAIDNGYQACMMAPTEILAQQHYNGIAELLKDLPVEIRLLTGSTKASEKKKISSMLTEGSLHILVGTHAIIEGTVQFKNLAFAVVDEQHRFGVAQRAKLWEKSELPPHILVMTATPIPRTLAMTAYGDLDYSIMD
ncbi:MAG TPA: ATP-dependent DNA helicase RecG [Chitinophagaceae bacterium]